MRWNYGRRDRDPAVAWDRDGGPKPGGMPMSHRAQKVREFLKEEVSQIIQQKLKDPRIGFVSVTDVEVSVDLRYATVFVSVLGDEEAKHSTMAGLQSAQGYIRGEVGRRLQIRYSPEIAFKLDESIERGTRVVTLIRQVSKDARHDDVPTADRSDPADEP